MKAVVFEQAGRPMDVLRVTDIADPRVTPGHVVVRVTARPIHPADIAFISGAYRLRPEFPQTAGLEGVGHVVDAAPGVSARPEMRVAFRWPGTWAEYAAVPEHRLIEVPSTMSNEVASQISLNPITAWGLLEEAHIHAGDCIVVTAAASGVANLVGAIARSRGIRVLGVVRGEAARKAGQCTVDELFSLEDPDLVTHMVEASGERRVQAVLDSVGGPIISQFMKTMSPGGHVIAYGVLNREPTLIDNATLIYSNLTWLGFGIDHWLSQLSSVERDLMHEDISSLIKREALALPVSGTYPLQSIGEALAANDRSDRGGKILLT